MIRIFQPTMGEAELAAVSRVMADQWPGAGPRVQAFERAFADYIGVEPEQTIAVTSCTEGLFQAIAALRLTPLDEVLLPTISFVGAAHAVAASGAKLRLTDVDPATLNPRPEHVESLLTPQTKAILLLHYGGECTWIPEIAEIARRRSIILIEDAACSLGGTLNSKAYGTFGDIGVWSFDAMKLLVTGDGGMIRVENIDLRKRIGHGVSLGGVKPGSEASLNRSEHWWELEPITWGRRSFMNDLAAAVGLVQLDRLEAFISRRKQIVRRYNAALSQVPWIKSHQQFREESTPYFYWIQTEPHMRDHLAVYLRQAGIYTTFRYWPLHRMTLYRDEGSYPGAELASATTLLLPVHQNLSDAEVHSILDAILRFDG